MSDEIDQIILADSASAVAEEPPRRRGIFGLRRRSKLPAKPLTHCENCGAPLDRRVLRAMRTARDRLPPFDLSRRAGRRGFVPELGHEISPFDEPAADPPVASDERLQRRAPRALCASASPLPHREHRFLSRGPAIDWDSQGPIQLTAQDRDELVASLAKMIEPDSPLTPEQRAQVEVARVKLAEAPRRSHRAGTRRAQEGVQGLYQIRGSQESRARKSGRRWPP